MSKEEIRDAAFQDYKDGMKYQEIADKYDVSLSTVKSWATRHWKKLQPKEVATEKKSCSPKKVATKTDKKKEAIAEEVKQVIENTDLTDKQRLFCLYYVRCFNATKAYKKAYGCDYNTAASIGYRLLEKDGVRTEIQRLKQSRLNREMMDENDIFQKYMDIAFADINDFAEIKGGMVKVKSVFDGTIVSEISDTATGVKIKLSDRMKAFQWLSDHMDLATEKQRAEIALIRSRAQPDEPDKMEDDGFLDALTGTAIEDWSDEESNI